VLYSLSSLSSTSAESITIDGVTCGFEKTYLQNLKLGFQTITYQVFEYILAARKPELYIDICHLFQFSSENLISYIFIFHL
jgi:hypothetical protein